MILQTHFAGDRGKENRGLFIERRRAMEIGKEKAMSSKGTMWGWSFGHKVSCLLLRMVPKSTLFTDWRLDKCSWWKLYGSVMYIFTAVSYIHCLHSCLCKQPKQLLSTIAQPPWELSWLNSYLHKTVLQERSIAISLPYWFWRWCGLLYDIPVSSSEGTC